jgi:beta-xylosidase
MTEGQLLDEVRLRYTNPVFPGYFADPFVWRAGDHYLAIGTGPAEAEGAVVEGDSHVFPLLRSTDLVHWEPLGRALVRPAHLRTDSYWAPEVAADNGRWYLYYSTGRGDKGHQLRVAVSDSPAGPYADDHALTDPAEVPFAIDPHPFRDLDGRWYLFHARDFLDHGSDGVRAGTALVVHELQTMTRLSKEGRTVLRSRCDWQRFARGRPMYGRTFDWHTLEGPFVIRDDGRYFCLYSGGCWLDESYGVDYAVASHPLGPWDGGGSEAGPRVLRSVPGRVLGPGHCSVVLGPDSVTRVLVYHAWDPVRTGRTMRIDELDFGPDGPRCDGPSWGERQLGARAERPGSSP